MPRVDNPEQRAAAAHKQWLMARNIIRDALLEIATASIDVATQNAAAIIARLANANPPLLICTPDEIKEETNEHA